MMSTDRALSRESVIALYRKHTNDLAAIRAYERHRNEIGMMYHDEERRLLYLLVRHFRPAIVVEFSPNKGWSTLHLARALEDNGSGQIHSFELEATNVAVAQRVLAEYGLAHRVQFYIGDVRRTLPPVLRKLGQPVDFLFVDSDHSYDFGRWWLSEVLPFVRSSGLVHVHDVEYSHRYGWGALTLTHQGGGVYGPPERRFLRPTRLQRSAWKGRLSQWLPLFVRKMLAPPDVRQALAGVHYTPGTTVADLTSLHGPGEALAVKEYLDAHPEVSWLSVMALIEDPDYRAAVAPYGGGELVAWADPWGYQRSPSLYFLKT